MPRSTPTLLMVATYRSSGRFCERKTQPRLVTDPTIKPMLAPPRHSQRAGLDAVLLRVSYRNKRGEKRDC